MYLAGIKKMVSMLSIYPEKAVVIIPILCEGFVVEKSQYVSREKWCRKDNTTPGSGGGISSKFWFYFNVWSGF